MTQHTHLHQPTRDPYRASLNIRAAVLIGVALRVALAAASVGSNDVRHWHDFGHSVWREGFVGLWRVSDAINHPPLPIAYAAAAARVAGDSAYAFGLLFKTPSILADALAIALVGRIVAARASPRAGGVAALLLAINPTSILIAAYHGNTDSVMAFLTLLAWWLASRGRMFWAGLAMAASINVKVGPVPSVLVLLACARTRPDLARLAAGLALGALPFVAMSALAGPVFLANLLGYRPASFTWLANVAWFSRSLPGVGPLGLFLSSAHRATIAQATLLIAALVVALRLRRPDRYDVLTLGATYWAAFMIWNGGGFQYSVWPVPLLAAVRPRLTLAYGLGAGVFVAWAYLSVRVPGWPLESRFTQADAEPWHLALGLPLLALLAILVSLLRGRPAGEGGAR